MARGRTRTRSRTRTVRAERRLGGLAIAALLAFVAAGCGRGATDDDPGEAARLAGSRGAEGPGDGARTASSGAMRLRPAPVAAPAPRGGTRRLRTSSCGCGTNVKPRDLVDRTLDWLLAHRDASGGWRRDDEFSTAPIAPPPDGRVADVAATALAVQAFLGAGYTARSEGAFGDALRIALEALARSRAADGWFVGTDGHVSPYDHALATLALLREHAATRSMRWVEPARRGLDLLADFVDPDRAAATGVRATDLDDRTLARVFAAAAAAAGVARDAEREGKPAALRVSPEFVARGVAWARTTSDRAPQARTLEEAALCAYAAALLGGADSRDASARGAFARDDDVGDPDDAARVATAMRVLVEFVAATTVEANATTTTGFATWAAWNGGRAPWEAWTRVLARTLGRTAEPTPPPEGPFGRTCAFDEAEPAGGSICDNARLALVAESYFRYDAAGRNDTLRPR